MPFPKHYAAQPRIRLLVPTLLPVFVEGHPEHWLMLVTIAACLLSASLHVSHLEAACLADS